MVMKASWQRRAVWPGAVTASTDTSAGTGHRYTAPAAPGAHSSARPPPPSPGTANTTQFV